MVFEGEQLFLRRETVKKKKDLKPISQTECLLQKTSSSSAVQLVDKWSEMMTFVHFIGTLTTPRPFSFLLEDFDFLSRGLAVHMNFIV